MKIHLFSCILLIGFITLSAYPVCAACQGLRIYGTAPSVPALATLLGAERVGHAARYALEGMSYPEAGAALRNALAKTSGPIKAGLVDSLGWRRDTAAVPLLVSLLSDTDTMLAMTTASTLGRIGSQDAITSLKAARENSSPEVRAAVLEALLRCAEERLSAGDDSRAAALYRDLFHAEVPSRIRTAAWRGLVESDVNQRSGLIVKALSGSDEQLRLVALKLVRETKDLQVVEACLRQWDSLPASAQLAVLDAHLQFASL